MASFSCFAPEGLPEIVPNSELAPTLISAVSAENFKVEDGDIFVLAHKIISKAEGRIFNLSEVTCSEDAKLLSDKTGKSPALCELILRESKQVLFAGDNGHIICLHRLGFVCANAAIDRSNAGDDKAILLPLDPDSSAASIRLALEKAFGVSLGVLICDTHGKAFREGACGTVIGSSGISLLRSYVGSSDRNGYIMHSSIEAVGDELAGAATLIMGQGDEGRPLAIIRGLSLKGADKCSTLNRPIAKDIFLSNYLKSMERG